MDQGGLKRNGNRDDSLTFEERGDGVGRDTGDTGGSLLQSTMHLPGTGSLTQPTVAPNGRGGFKEQGEFGGLFDPPQHNVLELDIKEGKMIRMEKRQHQDASIFNIEDSLSLSISHLDPLSTSVINTSENSVLGNLPLPDLFPQRIKQEGNFAMDKDLGSYSGHPGAGLCDLDGNSSRLLEESEIWQDLDLSSSLPEISDFELDSEVAHLDTILHDTGGGGGPDSSLSKEPKSLVGNGGNCTNVNGTEQQRQPIHHHHHHHHPHQQQQQQQQHLLQHQQHQLQHQHQQHPSLLSSVMIKEEKDPDDSFIHICTPGVVKQEKDSSSFCKTQCLQRNMSSLQGGGGPMSSPMGVSPGPGYHYRANPSSSVDLQDQKPFRMYSSLSSLGENWSAGNRYGESSGMQRGNDGLPSASPLSSFSVNFSKIHLLSVTTYPFWIAGWLEPIPAVIGREAWYTRDRSNMLTLHSRGEVRKSNSEELVSQTTQIWSSVSIPCAQKIESMRSLHHWNHWCVCK